MTFIDSIGRSHWGNTETFQQNLERAINQGMDISNNTAMEQWKISDRKNEPKQDTNSTKKTLIYFALVIAVLYLLKK